MRTINRVLDRTLAIACIVLFIALTVIVAWQVFARQVLGDPSAWTAEAAQYTFVWLGFFGAAFVFSERGHIAVDFLIRRFPKHLMRVALVFIQLTIIALSAVVFVYGGWQYSQQAWGQQVSSLPVNVGQMFIVMPIAGVLIIWFAITHLIEALRADHPIDMLAVDEATESALESATADPAIGLIVDDPATRATDPEEPRVTDLDDENRQDDDEDRQTGKDS